jgi:hypothetical protein
MTACGAKTRAGTPCRRGPVSGKTRCKLHGGASTGPRVPATKHGIYSTAYTEEENAILDEARRASLSEELALARVTLRRLLRAAPPPIGQGMGGNSDTDWWGLLDRFMGRVGRLAEQHARVEEVAALEAEVRELVARAEDGSL